MMVENCAITLVPITSESGESMVQETKACTLNAASSGNAPGNPAGSSPPAASSSPSSSDAASPPPASTGDAQPTDSTAAPSGTTAAPSGTSATTLVVSPSGTASATGGGAISVAVSCCAYFSHIFLTFY